MYDVFVVLVFIFIEGLSNMVSRCKVVIWKKVLFLFQLRFLEWWSALLYFGGRFLESAGITAGRGGLAQHDFSLAALIVSYCFSCCHFVTLKVRRFGRVLIATDRACVPLLLKNLTTTLPIETLLHVIYVHVLGIAASTNLFLFHITYRIP